MTNPEKVRFLDQFYNSPSLDDEVKDQVNDEFARMFELSDAAVREGILRDLPPEFHAVMISRVINGILTLTESNNTSMSDEEIIENGLAMLWK